MSRPRRKPIGRWAGPTCLAALDARAGVGAAIAAMASSLWGGELGAAESEHLNSHVTATDPEGSGAGARAALPGGDLRGGIRGAAGIGGAVECPVVEGRCGVARTWKKTPKKETQRETRPLD